MQTSLVARLREINPHQKINVGSSKIFHFQKSLRSHLTIKGHYGFVVTLKQKTHPLLTAAKTKGNERSGGSPFSTRSRSGSHFLNPQTIMTAKTNAGPFSHAGQTSLFRKRCKQQHWRRVRRCGALLLSAEPEASAFPSKG